MTTIKTSELSGDALDWAVAKIEIAREQGAKKWVLDDLEKGVLHGQRYSTDWLWAGTVMEELMLKGLLIEAVDPNYTTLPAFKCSLDRWETIYRGDTVPVAIMRCYAASEFGEEIDVPDSLVAETNPDHRNIFEDLIKANFIATSTSTKEDIRIRRDIVAREILGGYPQNTVISKELYDEDGPFGDCLNWMNPAFELPNWEGRTIGDFLIKHGIPGEPVCMNVIQISASRPNKDGVMARNITLQELFDAEPFGDNGWVLPSGVAVVFYEKNSPSSDDAIDAPAPKSRPRP